MSAKGLIVQATVHPLSMSLLVTLLVIPREKNSAAQWGWRVKWGDGNVCAKETNRTEIKAMMGIFIAF